jgi:hypothetical protein
VDVVEASGPDDPAIPFEPVVASSVTAIGWCAPIDGPDRPPVALTASLFRIEDGLARPVAYDRLEPSLPDALGELWLPRPQGVGRRPTWAMGRYVIELRTESGSYRRFLGLELMDRVTRAGPSGGPSPSGEPTPEFPRRPRRPRHRPSPLARDQRCGGSCAISNAARAITIAPTAAIHQP